MEIQQETNYKSTTNHFFFAFNNPTYYPGKPVDGILVLVVQNPIKISKIGLIWRGAEFVSWYQGVSQQEHCTAIKTIFDNDFGVGPKEGDAETVYKQGTYTFPFAWNLPVESPANFEETNFNTGDVVPLVFSKSGMPRSFGEIPSYIRYYATAYVDFSFPTEEGQEPQKLRMIRENGFKVAEAFDPKIIIQPPIVKKETVEFWLGGGPLEMQASVANGGVLFSGQNLYVNVTVKNLSTRSVDFITFILVEYLILNAPNPEGMEQTFERRREVLHAEVADSQIPAGGQFNQDLMFVVPAGTPPTILKASHLRRRFEILCELEVSFGTNPQLHLPIRILDWSPLLKDDLPKHVPITTKVTTPED